MSERHGISVRTLQRQFEFYAPLGDRVAVSSPPVALTFDATFFGRGYGLLVYRAESRNIYWQEIDAEKIDYIRQGLKHLQEQGWRFSSFTIDGRRGVIQLLEQLFPGTPVQLCLFHQKSTIRRYTTAKPKTDCGKAIWKLAAEMKEITATLFLERLKALKEEYRDFLKERNESGQFMHRPLRSAIRSLTSNSPYLYTWKNHPDLSIPNTTNSCDGSFAHWKSKVKLHRGLRKHRRTKMIQFLLSVS